MSYDTDVPPHLSAQRADEPAPVDAPKPNTAMLKGDIDSGRSGDKVEVFDPGMAMLGTCEEAGGNALSPKDIARARFAEIKERWRLSPRKPGYAHRHVDPTLALYVGFIGAAGLGLSAAIWFVRAAM
ncbi:hypothetical protein VQ03_05025 [Methylobacterium tarhaniae]|uniref:Uncharacterized protein n=1 Tax=Methylobacterium tarhaniae TaxID=1187852 RepID=A0A0J6TEP4_9HYPH|nr:hypothetical protein [Methylobacterium tarhaniae]KMO44133.1 hypothetical protein VQ03_05025 [Methylobacterium tarhaniae]